MDVECFGISTFVLIYCFIHFNNKNTVTSRCEGKTKLTSRGLQGNGPVWLCGVLLMKKYSRERFRSSDL